jgi:tetratricopeptide (TPR) repeat protein
MRDTVKPLNWISAALGMGLVYTELARIMPSSNLLLDAERIYRIVLVAQILEGNPILFTTTLTNLANVLLQLGEIDNSAERFEEALKLNRQMLEGLPRKQAPLAWAETQSNIGTVLFRLERLEEAVDAFHAALEEITQSQTPWATLQINLGGALTIIGSSKFMYGDIKTGVSMIEEAIVCSCNALTEIRRTESPDHWGRIQTNLGLAYWHLGRELGAAEYLRNSIDAYSNALQVTSQEFAPIEWTKTKLGIGMALVDLGESEGNANHIEQGIREYRAVVDMAKATGQVAILSAVNPMLEFASESLTNLRKK